MSTNANLSIDPADEDNTAGAFAFIFKKMMQGSVDNMLPCQVLGFNRDDPQRVQVQHLIFKINTNAASISRGQIASLPVLQLGGGGFVLTFPLKKGDFGWVKACDRDISNFLDTYAAAQPQTFRQFNFSDGVFIPDVMHGYTVATEDKQNAVLQSLDGTVKISIGLDKIKYKAPLHVFEGPVQFEDSVTVEGLLAAQAGITATGGGANSIAINGNIILTGNQRVDGDITAGGDITPHVP